MRNSDKKDGYLNEGAIVGLPEGFEGATLEGNGRDWPVPGMGEGEVETVGRWPIEGLTEREVGWGADEGG